MLSMSWIFLVFVLINVAVVANIKLGPNRESDEFLALTSTKFIFFYGPTYDDNTSIHILDFNKITEHPNFNPNSITTLYVHGYSEKMTDESLRVIISSYNDGTDHNLLVLDWLELASGDYLKRAVPNTQKFATLLAEILVNFFRNNKKNLLDNFHLVGHSLGGQLCGNIGREIISQSKHQFILPRITALDPAFPGFYIVKLVKGITAADAKYVDIIHTDAWVYGSPVSSGTADFWPNGGNSLQPGCPIRTYQPLTENDLCSHRRSWRFWAESVAKIDGRRFLAIRFNSYVDFMLNLRTSNRQEPAEMGLKCSTKTRGVFYLQTNAESPFAKGMAGTIYSFSPPGF